jgi:hypothetical protein
VHSDKVPFDELCDIMKHRMPVGSGPCAPCRHVANFSYRLGPSLVATFAALIDLFCSKAVREQCN